jgi:hypothetical protein
MKVHEKLPLSSKKFLAYLLADVGWKIILGILIYKNCEGKQLVLLLTIVIVSGFVQTGYILGQAALDRYVRIAEITTNLNKKEKENVLESEGKLEETHEGREV